MQYEFLIQGIVEEYGKDFHVDNLALYDTDKERLNIMGKWTERFLRHRNYNTKIEIASNAKEAIADSDFLVTVDRPGELEARRLDEKIAFKHGVVGAELTGPGGTIFAIRAIHQEMKYAKIAEEVAPDVWFINYTNPASFPAEALQRFSKIKNVGTCSVWPGRISSIAWDFGINYDRVADLFSRVKTVLVGSNQNLWVKDVYVDGKNVTKEWIRKLNQKDRATAKGCRGANPADEKIAIRNLIRMDTMWYTTESVFFSQYELDEYNRTGKSRADFVIPYENKHLEEAKNPELADVSPSVWPRRGIKDLRAELAKGRPGLKRPLRPVDLKDHYDIAASSTINAIINDTGDTLVCQVQNRGAIKGIEDYMVVEILCYVDRRGAHPLPVGEIPISVRGIVLSGAYWQSLTVEAAIEASYDKALLALLNCPYIQHTQKFKACKEILDEYLKVHKDYLPKFKSESGLMP